MKTPVLIPIKNDQPELERTLSSLSAEAFEPRVLESGSDDPALTAQICDKFNVPYLGIDQLGKMYAIQFGLMQLGRRAIDPVILLDADTVPIFPVKWHSNMIKALRPDEPKTPCAVGAPVWFDRPFASNLLRSGLHQVRTAIRRRSDAVVAAGPNMGVRLATVEVLEQVLSLPNYWPGEDRAIISTIIENGGFYSQPLSPWMYALCRKPGYDLSIAERFNSSHESRNAKIEATYAARAPKGTMPYRAAGF